ncbi:MAG: 50S ribosomal protein L29 [Terrimicrobiaceae bacterium]|nr:50S ribosomal protein L29 [Terrimicrobiaceae bacterium]
MKIQEIREMTAKELASRKNELQHEAFNLRIQKQGGQLEKPHLLRSIRRDVARIEMAFTEKTKAAAAK